MILIAPGTILAMTPKSDLLSGPTKENARTLIPLVRSNGPTKDTKNHALSCCPNLLKVYAARLLNISVSNKQ